MAGAEARAKAREAGTRTCEAEPGRARVTFRRALRSEAVRMRHSPLVVLHVALAVALGALAGAYFAFSAWDSLLGTDAFFQLLGAGAPLLAGISCGLAADAEQRAGEGANVLGVSSRRGALRLDLASREAYVGEATVPLTKTEFDVCEFLARHPGQAFSRDQIVENVLGWDAESAASTISVHVANARAKLKAAGAEPIDTVWGVGYKWTA